MPPVLLAAAAVIAAALCALALMMVARGRRVPPPDGLPLSQRVAFVQGAASLPVDAALGIERYFGALSDADLGARGCPSTARCLAAYRASIVPVPRHERAWIVGLVALVEERVRVAFPRLFAVLPRAWCFAKLAAAACPEGAFPHTHGGVVFLPDRGFLEGPGKETSRGTWRNKSRDLELQHLRVLLHEQLHVLQRAQPALVQRIYADVWGARRHLPISQAASQAGVLRRSNPDLDGWAYRYPGSPEPFFCVQAYSSPRPTSLSDSTALRFAVHGGSEGRACAYEHPNEAMAYLVANAVFPSPDADRDADLERYLRGADLERYLRGADLELEVGFRV